MLQDDDVASIVLNLTTAELPPTVLKSQTNAVMAHPSSGVWSGQFLTDDMSSVYDDKVNLRAYFYDAYGNMIMWKGHGDEWFATGTVPAVSSTSYTVSTNAKSNYTVKDLVVNSSSGRINWTGTKLDLHSKAIDFDSAVVFGDRAAYVNSSSYSELNKSAVLTFENVNCNAPYVYYSETAITRAAILADNNQCFAPRCTNIQCSGGVLTVRVSSFSGYAAEGNANLSIDADDPKYEGYEVHFTADYMNSTSGAFISGADCRIYFTDGDYAMAEGSGIYTYNRSFASAGVKEYNVTCNKTGWNTLTAFDNATIESVVIPEFSVMTLGLGLVAVLTGLIIIRKRH